MTSTPFQWAVVGAGPAGIAAVGKLIDHGVPPNQILWIDPYFSVGDLGLFWSNVSSNTKAQLFNLFLNASLSFGYQQSPIDFELNHLPTNKTCALRYMVEPLQWITDTLASRVHTETTFIHRVTLSSHIWSLHSRSQIHQARNVILATGATPNTLNHPEKRVIPFKSAIDQQRLKEHIHVDETYAVFGSSHSAIMIVKHLVDFGVKKIINFYQSPCRYAVDMDDWILFDNTGLKGDTATWARQHIDGLWPKNLLRHNSTQTNIARFLPECHQVIYAVGFTQRNTIVMDDYEHIHYNPSVGIIGPGLFGIGIAYPEIKADPFGNLETQVGLWKFMTYLSKVMPIWFKYPT